MLCAPTSGGKAVMTGEIVVVRDSSLASATARFAVRIDGKRVGKLRQGNSLGFDVPAGVHRVRVTQLGYSSKYLVLSVAEGESVVLRTRIRFWGNFLSGMSASLIGGPGFWLLVRPTMVTAALFVVGVAGFAGSFAAKTMISLRPDQAT